jgi:hypothetical protein
MNDNNGLILSDLTPLPAKAMQQQVNAIQEVMKQVMENGVHFGTVPGCGPKPALLKPGAEKICLMFGLSASFTFTLTDIGGGHREYSVICTLSWPSGRVAGQGLGSCSTMEKKYRYRKIYEGKDAKVIENPDIADTYNTVLKMAKKRAHVDATLTTTAASDIFTQDIEDVDTGAAPPTKSPPKPQPAPEQSHPNHEDESQVPGDMVAYRIPYDRKDEFKGALKDHGHRWDTSNKIWTGGSPVGGDIEQFRVAI